VNKIIPAYKLIHIAFHQKGNLVKRTIQKKKNMMITKKVSILIFIGIPLTVFLKEIPLQ
jgi:hypothetical protein